MLRFLFDSRVWLVAVLLGLPALAQAQTTVFTEDFEGGLGSFTAVNGSQTNQWHLGAAAGNGPGSAGSRAAYISNNNGVDHAYDTNLASITHLHREVTLPAGNNVLELSFDWKNQGEPGERDYLKVYVTPTSYVPAAGALLSGPDVVAVTPLGLCQQSGYARLTLPLPRAVAGSTVRLTFTWANNLITGTQPPAALDNVTLTASPAQPLPAGTYTVDATQPASTSNFPSLAAAFQRLNQAAPAGAVTFEVQAGQTFTQPLPPLQVSGAANRRIVFRKAGSGANPAVVSSGGAAAIDLAGADFVTFDGIDVQASGSGPVCGYRIRNLSATDGTQGLIVRNAAITLNRTTPNSVGLLQATGISLGTAIPTDTLGAHRNNRYQDLRISNAYSGLWLVSASQTYPDLKTEVAGVTVGSGSSGDIGASGLGYGIRAENQRQLSLHDNVIRGLQATAATVYGVYTLALQGSGAAACRIYNNRILDIRFANPTSTSTLFAVNGLVLDPLTGTGLGSTTIYAYNNEISGLARDYGASTAATGRLLRGIQVTTLGSSNNNQILLWHNTVQVEDAAAAAFTSAAFEFGGTATSGGLLDVRNNIFSNRTGAQTTGKHFAYYSLNPGAGPNGSLIDYNDLYVANTTGGFVGRTSAAEYATLADWRAATSQEANGLSVDPQFTAVTVLRPGNPALDNRGTPLPNLLTDLTGAGRSGTTPDIGAYEFTVLSTRAPHRTDLGLSAAPVPFGPTLTVHLARPLRTTATLELLDALGRPVRRLRVAPAATSLQLDELTPLPAGTYLLRLITADGHQQTVRLLH